MPFALRLRLRDMQRSIGSTGFLHSPVVSFLIESREAQTEKNSVYFTCASEQLQQKQAVCVF